MRITWLCNIFVAYFFGFLKNIKSWVYLPNEIPMHLDNPNTYTTKLIIFLPVFLSLFSLVFMFLYRKKENFKKITNLYLQYSLSLYFLYITNLYILVVTRK